MRQLVPTRAVPRGGASVSLLPRAERKDIDAIRFQPIGGKGSMTWAESLDANYTDGKLVFYRGRIVYERYFGVLTPEKQHIAFSVTKSFVSTVAATLIAEGVLDERATVARYVPELKQSGFGDATIRQLLDMTTGVKYSEDYADPEAPIGTSPGRTDSCPARKATMARKPLTATFNRSSKTMRTASDSFTKQ